MKTLLLIHPNQNQQAQNGTIDINTPRLPVVSNARITSVHPAELLSKYRNSLHRLLASVTASRRKEIYRQNIETLYGIKSRSGLEERVLIAAAGDLIAVSRTLSLPALRTMLALATVRGTAITSEDLAMLKRWIEQREASSNSPQDTPIKFAQAHKPPQPEVDPHMGADLLKRIIIDYENGLDYCTASMGYSDYTRILTWLSSYPDCEQFVSIRTGLRAFAEVCRLFEDGDHIVLFSSGKRLPAKPMRMYTRNSSLPALEKVLAALQSGSAALPTRKMQMLLAWIHEKQNNQTSKIS